MKAVIHTQYGPPEVAQLKEVPTPMPQNNEVLIKIHASTVNRTDCGFRSAEYVISRFWSGLLKPKYQTLGSEFAGEIIAIGKDVKQFKIGDKVFAYNDVQFGGHAEFVCINENQAISTIPNNYNFETAAPLTEGSHYAYCQIKAAKINAGQQVLVYGATGAIGSAALQLLKHFGATVTAVCNTKNIELIKSLGADTVIDYQTQDFIKTDTKFDVVIDAVGKSSFGVCKKLMKPKGVYISTELGKNAENVFLALLTPLFGGKKVLFPIPSIDKDYMLFIKDLAEKGEFRPLIDRTYPLEEIVEAYRYVETAQKTGNVVLRIV
ncbi:MAG: NAD(P)-dependent alcohol dehydrogenase [Bacteroidota bacterium]|nr:NAD(P)-dependent alcohol dehydrogenase [Bacteroidota bacterium]